MTPAARMTAMLAMLAGAPNKLLSSDALLSAISDYRRGDEVGKRTYRRDLAALVARGLVRSDLSTPRTPRRTGVQLVFIGKPKDWELTAAEHAALRAARTRQRRTPAPTSAGRTNRGTELDVAMDALRVLEEQGEWMLLNDLAAELSVPAETVLSALREMLAVDVRGDSVYRHLLLLEEFDPDTFDELPAEQCRAYAERSRRADRPLHQHGLWALGRFAYTASETADRVALIDSELADPTPDSDTQALGDARRKLSTWAAHLAAECAPGAVTS